MHKFMDELQAHWTILTGVGLVIWFAGLWVWKKLVASPTDLRDCRKDVSIEFGKYDHHNRTEHADIRDEMKANHSEIMQTLINILNGKDSK